MDVCVFCNKAVAPYDPERVTINNSGTIVHSPCFEEAKRNAAGGNNDQLLPAVQGARIQLDDGVR